MAGLAGWGRGAILPSMLARATGLILPLFLASQALAEVRAVLAGVGDYALLDADRQGPPSDLRLMAETLIVRGIAPWAIRVLTTDPTDLPRGVVVGAATRSEIMGVIDAAAAESDPGDTLVFHFSGHGAQAPDMSGDEGGGHDESLLPDDAASWKGTIGMVENAILDDELQTWAQAALSRGVQVIGLIDACHSATGFRAVGGASVARFVDEAQLGIPDDAAHAPDRPLPQLSGELAFLYSSQSDQRSCEYPLADRVTWHGKFTLQMARTLREAPEVRRARVLAATREGMVRGPARQMPEGEGPLLEAQVLGQGLGAARWKVAGDALAAGLLDGLAEGAEVALYSGPAEGKPLAVMSATGVSARAARLTGEVPEGGALWGDPVAAPPPRALSLAPPSGPIRATGSTMPTGWPPCPPRGLRPTWCRS